MKRLSLRIGLACALLALGGCATIVSNASRKFADNLTAGMLDQDDVTTARDGIPAWLILIDGLIQGDPQNVGMLVAGARLYGAYAGGFVDDAERATRLSARSFDYARRATCIQLPGLCKQLDQPFEGFQAEVARTGKSDVGVIYALASAWAGRIQTHTSDWTSIADIPKVQSLIERVVALEPGYQQGEPYMYLGVLATLRPASLGGKPEEGKALFEKALALSGGRNQMVRVLYAERYARLVFDQELHDRLLNEAIAADPHAPGLTLVNVLAQQRAKKLLESGKDFF
ncbi:TRAP transporter TatT component family protein [Dokdonella sp.]|uniref:TRAP transporter TatT component family protein n=1 Tax=Dokdonella sp. TaxID=2291710 RepID=UPI002617BAE6|nr:TRAP transporter TatT component family protein [Dokdonella sp.]